MNCAWCSNPEGINPKPLPLYNSEKCINDKLCVKACKSNAICQQPDASYQLTATSYQQTGNSIKIDRRICEECTDYSCAEACNTGAIKIGGYSISSIELFKRLQKDRDYWGEKGGITLTGGEPFYQPEFALEILKLCYESYLPFRLFYQVVLNYYK